MRKLPLIQLFRVLMLVCAVIIILTVTVGGSLYLSTRILLQKDINNQRKYLDHIRLNEPLSIGEESYSLLGSSSTLKINQVQVLATHNSYKKQTPWLYYSIGSLARRLDGLTSTNYAHNTLTEQLNSGIRGIVFDLRYQFDNFPIYHSPIFDNRTHNPLLKETLEELILWSNRHPKHFMINVIIQLKDDSILFNPSRKNLTADLLKKLDRTIAYTMGANRLVTPDILKNGYPDLESMVYNNAWLPVYKTRGKFMFLLHYHNEYTDMYIDLDNSLSTQAMVPLIDSRYLDNHKKHSAVLLHNLPEVDIIQQLVSDNYMVRTRMDVESTYDQQRRIDALANGAQIITTDLQKGRVLPKGNYNAYLEEEYTIRPNPFNT